MIKKKTYKKKVVLFLFLFLFLLLYLININEDYFSQIYEHPICSEYSNRNHCTKQYRISNITIVNTNYVNNCNKIKNSNNESVFVFIFYFLIRSYVSIRKTLRKKFSFPNIYASAKVIYGISNDKNVSKLSNFCYVNNSKQGVLILTNSYIPDSKLLIVDKTDDELYNYANNKNGKTCDYLEKEAIFVKAFNDIFDSHFKSSYIFYETKIDPAYFEKNLNFVLSNCGNNFKYAFKIEFRNNINFLKNHFSCEEQGLIEIYMLLMVLLGVLSLTYFRKKNELSHINNNITESINCSTLFFFLSNLFYFIHILTYAFNGTGFSVLKVLSQIYEAIFDCFITSIIIFILNKSANKTKKYNETLKWSFGYSTVKFLYILFEIQNHQDLNLYTRLRSAVGFPFVVVRAAIAVIIHNNTNKLLKEKKKWNEKFFIILEYIIYNSWIMTIPALFFLFRSSSLHFTHLIIHFSNLLVLIYLIYALQKKEELKESNHPYLDIS